MGRLEEIDRLRRKVRDSVQARRIEVSFVSGERRIRKSSLALFVRRLTEKELRIRGVHIFMGGVHTVEAAVRRIFDQLLKETTREGGIFERIKDLFGRHVREAGLFGISVEFNPDPSELQVLTSSFAAALKTLVDRIKEERPGILLIIDDLNGLADSAEFANWLKSLVDEVSVARSGLPVSLMLVGLEERRQLLVERQPSLARVFDMVNIRSWSESESREFIQRSFARAGIACDERALEVMTRYTGGLPVLAHEIGDSTFQADEDSRIAEEDALSGVLAAADVVGRKYLDPVVYKSLRSQHSREILRKLASTFDNERFTRAAVREELSTPEKSVFDNFLRKMKNLGVLIDDPEGGRGSYRFGTRLHYLYFFMQAQAAHSMNQGNRTNW